ncbi:MAG: RNase adapter RapZ [Proteobacteria bacterium]|nr:RNase adapter RapZ [Pseudomonadota bacterium]
MTKKRRVVGVTGMSGAGRSSALRILEDQGFEAIDNLPVSFLGRLVWSEQESADSVPLAVGVDIRTRDFHADAFVREIAPLRERADIELTVLFLDCDSAVLGRRFTETRRRHPLAGDRPVNDGIRVERAMLAPVLEAADLVIDTSQLALPDLRRRITDTFQADSIRRLVLTIVSFAFGKGLPREADLVFDVRFLRNPHYDENLRGGTGRDPAVAAYIAADEGFDAFFGNLVRLIDGLLPRYRDEGKSYLTIAVGCTGGRHRSVYVAERLARHLADRGQPALVQHRDLGQPSNDRIPI